MQERLLATAIKAFPEDASARPMLREAPVTSAVLLVRLVSVSDQCAGGAKAPGAGFLSSSTGGIIVTSTPPTSQNESR